MADILDFKKKMDPKVVELIALSNNIDALVQLALHNNFQVSEICGILAHRIGSYIEKSPDKIKEADVCIHILLMKAGLTHG